LLLPVGAGYAGDVATGYASDVGAGYAGDVGAGYAGDPRQRARVQLPPIAAEAAPTYRRRSRTRYAAWRAPSTRRFNSFQSTISSQPRLEAFCPHSRSNSSEA
jgi:hypothetical protein